MKKRIISVALIGFVHTSIMASSAHELLSSHKDFFKYLQSEKKLTARLNGYHVRLVEERFDLLAGELNDVKLDKLLYEELVDLVDSYIDKKSTRKIFLNFASQEKSSVRKIVDKLKKYTEENNLKNIKLKRVTDLIGSFASLIATQFSRGFGALAGNISWKSHGALYNRADTMALVQSKLKPLDLYFEKKAYKFTDYTIPGHWGHVGIYLGTKEQLIQEGLWGEAELEPFRETIEAGKVIYEMRRPGMVFNDLKNALDLDEFAVVRLKSLKDDTKAKRTIFKELARYFNSKYDYAFDVHTLDTVTCSEIISFSYGPVNWPLEKVVGRWTIPPNKMAGLVFYDSSPIEFVGYYSGQSPKGASIEEFARTVGYLKDDEGKYYFQDFKCNTKRVSRRKGGMPLEETVRECEEIQKYQYYLPIRTPY